MALTIGIVGLPNVASPPSSTRRRPTAREDRAQRGRGAAAGRPTGQARGDSPRQAESCRPPCRSRTLRTRRPLPDRSAGRCMPRTAHRTSPPCTSWAAGQAPVTVGSGRGRKPGALRSGRLSIRPHLPRTANSLVRRLVRHRRPGGPSPCRLPQALRPYAPTPSPARCSAHLSGTATSSTRFPDLCYDRNHAPAVGHERGSRFQLTALLFRNGAGPFQNHIWSLNSRFTRSG